MLTVNDLVGKIGIDTRWILQSPEDMYGIIYCHEAGDEVDYIGISSWEDDEIREVYVDNAFHALVISI